MIFFRILFVSIFLHVFIIALTASLMSGDFKYIGSQKCKICHQLEKYGNQYEVWEKSNHAHAYLTLGTKKAKEVAKKLGVTDPQNAPECLKCHIAGYGKPDNTKMPSYSKEDGVSCESCHGPGSSYQKLRIMKSREASVKAGLIPGDLSLCDNCHNDESPVPVGEFDVNNAWEKIKHPLPQK
ncbi:MAG: cytochrome C554 [candidate division Zixibacteria bacterium]|nr:cytochrome C554 [candidate division Zixibacteria bacterium]